MAAFFWDKHHNRFHSDRRRRRARFWRFRKLLRQVVASLSDNQLVTGLALSIPLIYRVNGDTGNNFTTVYTYNLVAFMLMLTLIAHACALLVCDHYFTRKKVLGSILRIIAIGAVLVLTTIVFASILRRGDWPLGSSANVALPAKCYIRNCERAVYLGSVQQHGLRFGSITLHILVWVVYAIAVFYQFIKFHYPQTAPEDEDKEKEPGFRDEDHNWKWRVFNALRLFFPAIAFSGAAWALWGSRNFHFTAPSPHPPFTEDSQNMWTFGQIVPFVRNHPLPSFLKPSNSNFSWARRLTEPQTQVLLLPSLQTIFDSYGGKLFVFKFVPVGAHQADKHKDAYYQPERNSGGNGANGRSGYTRCSPNDGD